MPRLLFLLFALPTIAGQLSVPAAPRTLQNIAQPPKVEDIEFVDFRFEQPQLYHLRAHYGPIEGEPSAGVQYGVEAVIGGE
ncbi:MAG TPA: hypothetical protein VM791_02315 [Vicinamibacterales bacterium]|jgi:hypothetical protein|nr:hypothetical protein [Vicinamibacterales bacterium]